MTSVRLADAAAERAAKRVAKRVAAVNTAKAAKVMLVPSPPSCL